MSNNNLGWFLFFWIAFTFANIKVSILDVEEIAKQRYEEKLEVTKKNKEPEYIALLNKIKDPSCTSATDKEKNTFYACADGTKVSMINWTRGSDRKGVVTREYDATGKLVLIYGHPDDVY